MLVELSVEQLGVIDELRLLLGPGLTVLTGETGAGKTLVVEALELLLGGRADPAMVRSGADEAVVEGRFADGEAEIVLARAVPRSGRGRTYLDGRMAPLAALAEAGADLVDLYGQHAHQSLLRPAAQRGALDRYAGVQLTPVRELRRRLAELDERIATLGGDERERARELDVLSFQLQEIGAAALTDPGEEESLQAEEAVLAAAAALRVAADTARAALDEADPGAVDLVASAVRALEGHGPLGDLAARLRSLGAELGECSSDLRRAAEGFEEDPVRLAAVQERRALLRSLRRKYGETLGDVIAFAETAAARAEELQSTETALAKVAAERKEVLAELAAAEDAVGETRRGAAGRLAGEVEARLHALALERARVEIAVPASGIGDDVEFLLAANAGEPALPLTKVASGGELARAMLALRLVLSAGPPTLVFDEVDAGIGGMAALAVGAALAELARDHQVLVVTHLAQVAAQADHHLAVTKVVERGRTRTVVTAVAGEERVAELSRMLSGHPDSPAARRHAEELLARLPSSPPARRRRS